MTPTIELESELLPNDLEFDRMRDDLLARLDEPARLDPPIHLVPGPRTRRNVRTRRAIGAGVLVAAVVAATLVVANVAGPHGATAEAAEVLHGAALAAVGSSDPVVGPGQYLKVESNEAAMLFGDHAAVLTHQQITLYVPADRSKNWVLARQELPVTTQYGDATSLITDWESDRAGGRKFGDRILYSAKGGDFVGYATPAELVGVLSTTAALSTYLYAHATGQLPKDQEVYGEIRQYLDDGLVPAKTRAAMYEVLADIPGVYVTPGKANLDGRTGVGISLLDSTGNYIQQIIIDPTTGLLIGTRDLDVTPAGKVPAGVSQDWTAVTTSVVDSAPTGPFATEQQPG